MHKLKVNRKIGLHNHIIFIDKSHAKNSQKITILLLDADAWQRVKYNAEKRRTFFVGKGFYASYIQVG